MKPEITVQLYSVREQAQKNYEATIRAIADMGFGCLGGDRAHDGASIDGTIRYWRNEQNGRRKLLRR